MAVTVPIDFLSRFEKSLDALDDFAKDVSKKTTKMEKDFESFGTVLKGLGALFVADKIVDGIKKVVNASAEAEKSLHGMELALKLAGDFSQKASQQFQDLATQIQATSVFDDDLVLSQVAVAKQFGATNEEAEALIKASVDLASATDGDLNKAVLLLGKSLDGTAGKLAETVPEVKALTAAQLAAGGAIEVVAKRFSGAGIAALDTYSGALQNAENRFGGLEESLGDVITKNQSVIETIKQAGILFDTLSQIIQDNRTELGQLVTGGVLVLAKSFGVVLEAVRYLQETFEILWRDIQQGIAVVVVQMQKFQNFIFGASEANAQLDKDLENFWEQNDNAGAKRLNVYDKLIGAIADFGAGVEAASEKVGELSDEEEKAADKRKRRAREASIFAEETKKDFEGLKKSLEFVGSNPFDTLAIKFNKQMKIIDDAKKLGFITDIQREDYLSKLKMQNQTDLIELQKKADDERRKKEEEFASRLKEIVSNPVSALFSEDDRKGRNTQLTESQQVGVAGGLGVAQLVLGGKEGAKKLIGSIGSAVGTAFLGPAGEAVGPLLEALSAGPDAVRDMVKQFTDAIPDLIQAIIEALPVLIEELANQIPVIIERLVERAPDIILALIRALPKLIFALISMMPRVIWALIEGVPRFIAKLVEGAALFVGKIVAGAADFVKEILKGAVDFVGKIVEGAAKFVEKILSGPKLGPGGSGIIPGVNIIPDKIPIIGGLLKGSAGGDTNVVSSKGGGSALGTSTAREVLTGTNERSNIPPIQVNLVIGQQQFAKAIFDVNRAGYRTS